MAPAYDEAAAQVPPLMQILNAVKAEIVSDARASGGRTSPQDFAARVQRDPEFAALVSNLYTTFCDSSNLLIDCVQDHVRLELLIDPEIENTDILLPSEIVEEVPEDQRHTFPRRVLIDRTIAAFAPSMEEETH